MSTEKGDRLGLESKLGMVGLTTVLIVLSLLAIRLVTGRGLGLWTFTSSRIRSTSGLVRAVVDRQSVSGHSSGDFINVIFLHHSTGYNLIEEGGVREKLTEAGYSFWDHGYNARGLRRPDGSATGYNYNIPGDNTDPDGLAKVFSQRVYGLPLNAFSGLLQHEVIVFKSCFPVSQIASDEQLKRYKSYYLDMRDAMDAHPDKIFIVVTPPPLNPAATDPEAAARAQAFSQWLSSEEYLDGHPNVFTFDFSGHLAEDDQTSPDYNMLRAEYRQGENSHPNRMANEAIGPLFVDFIVDAVRKYRADHEPGNTE